MTAALWVHTFAAMDRIIGGDPVEPAPACAPGTCSSCDGSGRVENDAESAWAPMWRDCGPCEGTGLVDPFLEPTSEPNVLDAVDPVWGLPAVERLRVLRERSTS